MASNVTDNPADSLFNSGKALSAITGKIPLEKVNLADYQAQLQKGAADYKAWSWKVFIQHGGASSYTKSFPHRFWITSAHTQWFSVDADTEPKITLNATAGGSDILEIWSICTGFEDAAAHFMGNDHIYFNPPLEINPNTLNVLTVRRNGAITNAGAYFEMYLYGFQE